jgi:hypothetical protein
MIDVSQAFSRTIAGVSIWETGNGQYQVSLRRRSNNAFAIGVADTIDEAWRLAFLNGGFSTVSRKAREVDDLA